MVNESPRASPNHFGRRGGRPSCPLLPVMQPAVACQPEGAPGRPVALAFHLRRPCGVESALDLWHAAAGGRGRVHRTHHPEVRCCSSSHWPKGVWVVAHMPPGRNHSAQAICPCADERLFCAFVAELGELGRAPPFDLRRSRLRTLMLISLERCRLLCLLDLDHAAT